MALLKPILFTLLIGSGVCVPVSQIMEDDPLELQTLSLSFLPDEMEMGDIVDFNYESSFIHAKISTSKVSVTGLNSVSIKFEPNNKEKEKKLFVTVESPEEIAVTGIYSGIATPKSAEFPMLANEYSGAGAFSANVKNPKIKIVGEYEEIDGVLQFKEIKVKITFDAIQIEAENMKYGKEKKLVDWKELNAMLNGSEYDEMWETMIEKLIHARLIKLLNGTLKEMELSMDQLLTYATAFASL